MTAITPNIIARVEYARDATSGSDGVTNGSGFSGNNGKNGKYTIPSVDFGLVERPRAQLEIEKEVENVKVTLSDGTILFDNTQGAKNIVWQDNKQWDVKGNEATLKEEGTSKYTKGETVYRNLLRDKLPGANKTGRIQVIIDNELMYGATIQIIYNVSIKNAGEVDYVGNKYVENKLVNEFEFYAKGITSDNNGISTVKSTTTSADEVICYIPNNMQFDKNIPLTESENDKWDKTNINSIYDTGETLTDEELIQHVTGANRVNNNLVNEKLKHSVETFNTIITTNELSEELTLNLNRVKTLKLIVSELMTKSAEDDLSYESIVEIVKTTNTVGRRMAYSVVGNQHPYQAPAEVDASKGEVVQVLPPFGTSNVMYYALALAVAAILGVGIFLIKKKVVK